MAAAHSTATTEDDFFANTPAPKHMETNRHLVQEFLSHHNQAGRRIVLITSGGTTVPFEANTVRFLDNFSAGTRGSISAEKFLELGYAVIFLHREYSLEPYSRHYSHEKNCLLDFFHIDEATSEIRVKANVASGLLDVLRSHESVLESRLLLQIPFVSLTDYLHMLRMTCECLHLCSDVIVYLAAAVSDFYIPTRNMVSSVVMEKEEHKIQSSGGPLLIKMDPVPKMLRPLVKEWIPNAYIVSFKLETDENLLIGKARFSLERYGHQLVVANLLHSRKQVVTMVPADGIEYEIRLTKDEIESKFEIEEYIVADISKRLQK